MRQGSGRARLSRRCEPAADLSRAYAIGVTVRAIAGGREAWSAAGMDNYLPKPITLAGLEAVLIESNRIKDLASVYAA
mgnify:CR=1 FL=1